MELRGFTLVELITVILILSVLAVFVVPRFLGGNTVSPVSAQAQVIAAARRAQQLAMNGGPAANVRLATDNANNRVRITHSGANSPIDFELAEVTVTATNLSYDALGNAYTSSGALAATLTLTISNGVSRNVCIEPTGYAHDC